MSQYPLLIPGETREQMNSRHAREIADMVARHNRATSDIESQIQDYTPFLI